MRARARQRGDVPGRWFALAVTTVAVLAGDATAAYAQSISWFRLTHLSGAGELSVDDKQEKRYREGGDVAFESDQLELTETALVQLAGYTYHPKLLRFVGLGRLTLFQDLRQDRYYLLPTGRLNIGILQEHPYGLLLLANASRSEVDREFARTYRLLDQTYGAETFYRIRDFRLDGGYSYQRRTRTGGGSDLRETMHEVDSRARYQSGPNTEGNARYRLLLENFRGDALAPLDVRIQTLSWRSVTKLGDTGHRRATGSVRLRERASVDQTYNVIALAGLSWRHVPTLTSDQRLSFRADTVNEEWRTSVEVLSSLRHQLYESLTSTAELYALADNASFGSSRLVRGEVREQYTKRLGSFGRLNLTLAPFGELLQDRPDGAVGTMIDENVVFDGFVPVELTQLDIETETIVVTDAEGVRQFLVDVDYLVTKRGAVVELSRLASGDIPDGTSVLVDYQFVLTGDADIMASGVVARSSVAMPYGLMAYANYERRHQRAIAAEATPRLESLDAAAVGVRWRRAWAQFQAELADRQSTFTSYWSTTESLRLSLPTNQWLRASTGTQYNYVSFYDDAQTVTRVGGDAKLGAVLARRWSVDATADYLRERWTGGVEYDLNDIDAMGVKLQVRLQLRRLTVALEGRVSRINRSSLRDDYNRVFLSLRREVGP